MADHFDKRTAVKRAAVKTLTKAGAKKPLALAVIAVAEEVSAFYTGDLIATGDLITKKHFDDSLSGLEKKLGWYVFPAWIAIVGGVIVGALKLLDQ